MGIGGAIGNVVGAVGGAVGGYFGQKSAEKQSRKMARWQAAENERVLRNQIQWRVEDATKAGLHPLAALGVNPASGPSGQVVGDSGWMERTGQNIGGAVESALSTEDKTAVHVAQLSVERGRLENELLKTQIASERMRNIQQGTPGVPQGLGDQVNGRIAIPGTSHRVPQEHPNLAQQAENAYGEIGGELFGLGNLAVDAYRYMGLERILTGDDITPMIKRFYRAVQSDTARGGYKSRYLGGR